MNASSPLHRLKRQWCRSNTGLQINTKSTDRDRSVVCDVDRARLKLGTRPDASDLV